MRVSYISNELISENISVCINAFANNNYIEKTFKQMNSIKIYQDHKLPHHKKV